MLLNNSIKDPCATELSMLTLHLLGSMLLYGTNITNTIVVTKPVSSISKEIYFDS